MRAAIFNPYFDTLGGGERYTAEVARTLLKNGYEVDIEWNNESLIKNIMLRFGINIQGARVVADIGRGDGYDLTFWVSDGSVPTLKSRKNILHFQVPFQKVSGSSLVNRMKMYRIDHVVCNSYFTKEVIDKEFSVKSVVVYPPVEVDKFLSKRKENTILYVGRFSKLKQSKRQDVLVEAFKELYDSGLRDWKMVLAGGSEVGDSDFSDFLKKQSQGYPIRFVKSPNFKEITNLFGVSKIFWSASGFGVEEGVSPDLVEHFGITVVEAMASGGVPFVYNAGGHKEIIDEGVNGFLWNTTDELKNKTQIFIKENKFNLLSKEAKAKSVKFSAEEFEKAFLELV